LLSGGEGGPPIFIDAEGRLDLSDAYCPVSEAVIKTLEDQEDIDAERDADGQAWVIVPVMEE
jgi:hypothetical protein